MAAARGKLFWFTWGFDALIAATFLFFFLWGLATGPSRRSTSSSGWASWRVSLESSAEAFDFNRRATRGRRWGCS